ncbi:MAG TPA: CDGSH iron-sulfur domain-containing protein [Limnochordia bacterium]|nr:CDGSH iron-sulfur domain-containing protein [Limnochordia bacterium]
MAEIKVRDNGPYLVSGTFELVDAEGNRFETKETIALCRCGHSGTKPFCDGSHRRVEFQSAPRAAEHNAQAES